MDVSDLINILVGLIMTLMGGWLLRLEGKGKEALTEANRVRDRVIEVEKDLARNYHSKSELREVVQDAMRPVHVELERLSRAVEKLSEE